MARAKPLVFLLCLAPAFGLAWAFFAERLGFNPIEALTRSTGRWTLHFLLLTLAITPLRRLPRLQNLIAYRRMLGLFAFFYGLLHLTTWVWFDRFFDLSQMAADLTKRRFIMAGMAAFAAMIPLALTSTRGSIRRLGRNWTRLHRLVYFSAAAAVVHFWWLVKSDIRQPLLYALILAVLLAARLLPRAGPNARPGFSRSDVR